MNNKCTVSVIIPTYCPKDYLWACLESLVVQTLSYSDYEVIIVLNGDLSKAKSISAYIDSHREVNFILLKTETAGVSNARNVGIDSCNGEYITFIDDDDFVSPTYLEELLCKASPNTVSLCYPLSFIDGTDKYVPYNITDCYHTNVNKNSLSIDDVRSYFSGPVYKLIHRDIIGDRRYDTRLVNGEDTLFMFEISNRIKQLSFTSRNAVYYRRFREGSATNKNRTTIDHIKSNTLQIREVLKSYFKDPLHYNFGFFASRCGAGLYDIFNSLIFKNK